MKRRSLNRNHHFGADASAVIRRGALKIAAMTKTIVRVRNLSLFIASSLFRLNKFFESIYLVRYADIKLEIAWEP
jgi:hypothetical protein